GGAKPRYNRRSRFPEKVFWLKLTQEAFPRLSIVREVKDDGAAYLGPFSSTRLADDARNALHEAVPLRQCTQPISTRTRRPACVLHEMGRCGAPCEGKQSQDDYRVHAEAARRAMTLDATPVFSAVSARMERLSVEQRYEEASVDRDRLAAFVRTAARMQRLAAVTRIPHLVAASPAFDGGWDIHVIRHGRLAAAGVMPRGAHPTPFVESLTARAETVIPGPGPIPAASAEETECILRWLESPGVRLVEVEGEWSLPARGAARHKARTDPAPPAASFPARPETVTPAPGPIPAASAAPLESLLRWLEPPGVRLLEVEGDWSPPARGAARHKARIDRAYQGRDRVRHREG